MACLDDLIACGCAGCGRTIYRDPPPHHPRLPKIGARIAGRPYCTQCEEWAWGCYVNGMIRRPGAPRRLTPAGLKREDV